MSSVFPSITPTSAVGSSRLLSVAADLEEALPPATADTLLRTVDTITHAVVVVRVMNGVGHGSRQRELDVSIKARTKQECERSCMVNMNSCRALHAEYSRVHGTCSRLSPRRTTAVRQQLTAALNTQYRSTLLRVHLQS